MTMRPLRALGNLKNELVYHQHYQTRAEAMSDIQSFIEIFTIECEFRLNLVLGRQPKSLKGVKWLPDLSQI